MRIVIAIVIFSLIVIFHELGHFLLAKYNHIGVVEFSLGMGPKLISHQWGETLYCIKLLPFGGSCIMVGEDEEDPAENSFSSASVWARISVVAAGPIFNFIMAFFLSLFIVGSIGYDKPVIYKATEGMPAEAAGIQGGDEIVKLNNTSIHLGREITIFSEMNQYNKDKPVRVVYKRDGEKKETTLIPAVGPDGRYYLGFTGLGTYTKGGVFTTVFYSAYEVKYWIETTIKSLRMMFMGRVSVDDVSGPVGVVTVIGETYEESRSDGLFYVWLNMLNISILLSANLGVMNLLPIPALDGGRLLFLIIEVIRGKQMDPDKEGMVHTIGLFLLLALMAFVMFNDIRKLIM